MQIKSLALTVKFLFLALFSVSFSLLPVFYRINNEEYRLILFLFGVTYSLFVYTFGGVEKNKVSSFNSVLIIFGIANLLSFLVHFAVIGFLGINLDFNLVIILIVLGCVALPLIVYFTYFYLFGKLPPKRCIIIGSKNEWEESVNELINNSLISLKVLDYIDLQDFNEEYLRIILQKKAPINQIICTNFSSYKKQFLQETSIPFISINILFENQCKRIPIDVIKSFEEYYRLNFANISMSRGARLIDTIVCVFFLLLSSPLLLLASICILIFDGGPIFFKQERHGFMGTTFLIYKLRTWDVDESGQLVSTLTGHILRKIRLNEVPQFYNVLKGDMSLVGPRPDVPSTYKYCIENIPFYHYRNFIRPGITGHAQVSFKYIDKLEVETFSNRLSYDLFYVKNNSFFLYLTTLIKTIESIFFLRGS